MDLFRNELQDKSTKKKIKTLNNLADYGFKCGILINIKM
jgi:hypothetical protein